MFLTGFVLHGKYTDEHYWHKIIAAFVASLPLIIISSIRYDVGQDYLSYVRIFDQAIDEYRQPGLEIPYYELNRLIYYLGGDYVWLFTICSVLFMVLVFIRIMEDSPFPKLSVYLLITMLYYFAFFNTMRQYVGCSFLLYSIKYIRKREALRFGICIALACCFHLISLTFIPVYYLYGKKIQRKAVITIVLLMFILVIPLSKYILWLASFTLYEHYIGGQFDTGEHGYVTLMITATLFLFATIFYDSEDIDYSFFYYLLAITLGLLAFEGKVVLIGRIRGLFSLPNIIFLPMIIEKVKSKDDQKIFIALITILYGIYFYYTVGINNSNNVLPYQTIFSR